MQGQNAEQMQQQHEAMKRFVDRVDYSMIGKVKMFKIWCNFSDIFYRSVVVTIYCQYFCEYLVVTSEMNTVAHINI